MQLTTHHTTTLLYLYISHNTNFWIFYFCSMDNPVGVYLFVKYFIFASHLHTANDVMRIENLFGKNLFRINFVEIFTWLFLYNKKDDTGEMQDQNYISTHAVPSTLKFIVCLMLNSMFCNAILHFKIN